MDLSVDLVEREHAMGRARGGAWVGVVLGVCAGVGVASVARTDQPIEGDVRPSGEARVEDDPLLRLGRLDVGDRAPALGELEWVAGGRVEAIEEGKVGVIGFWVPGFPQGRDGGRVLTALRHAWPEVQFAYVAWADEAAGVTAEATREYVASLGSALDLPVGFDATGASARAYVAAAGVSALPWVFVVDPRGVVVWHGSPLSEQVAGVVDLVRRGEWDWKEYKRIRDLEARGAELLRRAQEAWGAGDREECVALLQEGFDLDRARFANFAVWKFHALHSEMGESDRAYEYARGLIEGPLKANPDALAGLAWVVVEAPAERRYDDIVAETAVRRALELAHEQHGPAWGALAIIQTRRENYEDALASWERALSFVPSDEVELVYLRKQAETREAYERALRGG